MDWLWFLSWSLSCFPTISKAIYVISREEKESYLCSDWTVFNQLLWPGECHVLVGFSLGYFTQLLWQGAEIIPGAGMKETPSKAQGCGPKWILERWLLCPIFHDSLFWSLFLISPIPSSSSTHLLMPNLCWTSHYKFFHSLYFLYQITHHVLLEFIDW